MTDEIQRENAIVNGLIEATKKTQTARILYFVLSTHFALKASHPWPKPRVADRSALVFERHGVENISCPLPHQKSNFMQIEQG